MRRLICIFVVRTGQKQVFLWQGSYCISEKQRLWMDGWVSVLHPFNSISVISRRWKGEHERLCAMKRRLGSGRISPSEGFEPETPWSEVGSANCSAMRTLHQRLWQACADAKSNTLFRWYRFRFGVVCSAVRYFGVNPLVCLHVAEKSFTLPQENDSLENPPSIFLINFSWDSLLFAV